ncbi:MAG TPA: 50S ribosomal protein L10 [Gammaproteobacteria bacterium]|nr:50S ribosomal protein L10 [Gammaproteobacteria bacterium]
MTLKLNDKKEIVAIVAEVASQAVSVVAADYRGLTAAEMTTLRANARQAQVNLKIVRNTLARIALKGTEFECINNALTGPIILAFTNDEPGASARLMRDFAKEHEKLEVKAISLGGQVYDKSQLDFVAKLPTKSEAIARLLSVMQAPISKLVRTLAEPQAKLVRTLAAIRDTKQ